MASDQLNTTEKKIDCNLAKLAVFDFDGTSISGSSPVMLVYYLIQKKMLRKSVVLRIIAWAIAYKFRLPQKESWVRGLVFSAFQGQSKTEVDQFLKEFYDQYIDHKFRKDAEKEMIRHSQEGRVVIVVSATFEPIVLRAMQKHGFEHQISTRMRQNPDGHYTREVEGMPIEGLEKLKGVQAFANKEFGEGGWILEYAYGDHHSDRPLLHAAQNAYAVTPDSPLQRTANKEGWPILDWQ